ncbi:MAG: histidine kinase dimerization/phosphoacceptor domain -containing protein, partial [Anaerolineales bacterium]
ELTNRRKDGNLYPEEMTITPVRDAGGEITNFIAIKQDISERKRAEDRIRHLNRLKEDLLSSDSLDEKLKRITDEIVAIFEADFARIWVIKPGDRCDSGCFHARVMAGPHVCRYRDRCLHLMTSSGRYTHTAGEMHRRVPFGCYKIGRVAAGEDPNFITNDVMHDPHIHDHDWSRKLGLVSFAVCRLLSTAGEPIGVLALFSQHVISPEEDALLEGLANTTAQVIQTARAEKALRESEKRYYALFEEAPVMYLTVRDESGTPIISNCNAAFLATLGYSRDKVVEQPLVNFYTPESQAALLEGGDFQKTLKDELKTPTERYLVTRDGRTIVTLLRAVPEFSVTGQVIGTRAMFTDITERKQAEEQIRASLKEKEVLLQEIHHRVKNNLQVISSLLNLQSSYVEDPYTLEIFQESQHRIRSMALIHEKLYQAPDLARVDLGEYIQSLAAYLFRSYRAAAGGVSLKIQTDDVSLGIDAAVPCGLILNELVSNSLKYAFPASPPSVPPTGRSGPPSAPPSGGEQKGGSEICIELRANGDGQVTLRVSDNGVGFPAETDFQNTTSLGLQLVNTLVNQLNGAVELDGSAGTEFKIMFTVP